MFEAVCNALMLDPSFVISHNEGTEYDARSLELSGQKALYREAKLTPKKVGHFVALWKRAHSGDTAPFDESDDVAHVIIAVREGDHVGFFKFDREVLLKRGIFSSSNKSGKRGFRLYAPWVVAESKQASATQKWQVPYFTSMTSEA